MMRLVTMVLLSTAAICFAQGVEELAAPERGAETHAVEAPTYSHPTLPAPHTTWPFPLLMLVGVMFSSAVCIGWYIRMEMPEELPPTHSHDEPPGASHHHGHGGTINPAPDGAPDHHA